MSLDPVSRLEQAIDLAEMSHNVSLDGIRAAIDQHVAEAVAREREGCADVARQWEDNYVIEDSAPRHVDAAIRARAEKDVP